ncbi:Collagen alpha-1 [Camelus dromedarius]|uniref:Collagen alpha-1 n=1 Tax=Camelus dromedarius TaxID=9838 RepID=A0A5N4CUQ1_CAMDR|nr:Collagen alpha-1 [Camelus dromedarius]
MRARDREIGVLITDGESQDDAETTSRKLKDECVQMFAIGVKNADEAELKMIAADLDDTHTYNFYENQLERNTVIKDLKPKTEYVVSVSSVVENEYSEPLKSIEKTC